MTDSRRGGAFAQLVATLRDKSHATESGCLEKAIPRVVGASMVESRSNPTPSMQAQSSGYERLQKSLGATPKNLPKPVNTVRMIDVRPSASLVNSAPMLSRGELLAKAQIAAAAGRITWREVAEIETAVNAGRLPDQEGMARIFGPLVKSDYQVPDKKLTPENRKLLGMLSEALEAGRIDFTEAARAETLLSTGEDIDDDLAHRILGRSRA
jgi:hypothetical protein